MSDWIREELERRLTPEAVERMRSADPADEVKLEAARTPFGFPIVINPDMKVPQPGSIQLGRPAVLSSGRRHGKTLLNHVARIHLAEREGAMTHEEAQQAIEELRKSIGLPPLAAVDQLEIRPTRLGEGSRNLRTPEALQSPSRLPRAVAKLGGGRGRRFPELRVALPDRPDSQ